MSERFRTLAEQSEWLRLSERTVRRHALDMGAVRVGRRLLFPETKTLTWLGAQGLGPTRSSRLKEVRRVSSL